MSSSLLTPTASESVLGLSFPQCSVSQTHLVLPTFHFRISPTCPWSFLLPPSIRYIVSCHYLWCSPCTARKRLAQSIIVLLPLRSHKTSIVLIWKFLLYVKQTPQGKKAFIWLSMNEWERIYCCWGQLSCLHRDIDIGAYKQLAGRVVMYATVVYCNRAGLRFESDCNQFPWRQRSGREAVGGNREPSAVMVLLALRSRCNRHCNRRYNRRYSRCLSL